MDVEGQADHTSELLEDISCNTESYYPLRPFAINRRDLW